jgi:NAD(P)-dependent dehydrogenase (short-subunit alcohol dehydrogenase family)
MFEAGLMQDRVVVITGGGTGLGRSMAERLGALGAKLVLTARRGDVLAKAAGEIHAATGAEVLPLPCDVRDPEAVEEMIAAGVDRFGRVDDLVNNAAGNFLARTETLSPNAFRAVTGIVLDGTFYCTTAFGRHAMERGGGGSVLNIVTTYAWTGSAFVIPSACAKAGVLAMTRSLAVEWARHGIRLNAIAPGPFPTEGAWKALVPDEASEEHARAEVPMGRFGEHAELANLATFLLAPGAGYITGECVTIDGGRWLMSGEFNRMTLMPPGNMDALLQMMRGGGA